MRKKHLSNDDEIISPQMTSLIDVMTILLVFLIQNFSAQGNLITPQTDISLPYSETKTTPLPAFIVQITQNEVRVQGVFAVRNSDFENRDDLEISELIEILKKDEHDKRIIIEADKNLPFNIVKKVCYSCSVAGFENFEILTSKEL
jgi:biopolymer transport protein ExbD